MVGASIVEDANVARDVAGHLARNPRCLSLDCLRVGFIICASSARQTNPRRNKNECSTKKPGFRTALIVLTEQPDVGIRISVHRISSGSNYGLMNIPSIATG